MPPGRSGGGYASPLPPIQPDPTQAPPVGEASLSVQPAPPPMQYPSTWGQMAAAPPPQAVDIQAPPTTDAQWQAQQYASGDAYSTGIDAAPDWTPQPPSQSHAWDAMYGAPPLKNRTLGTVSSWLPYWDGSGIHRAGGALMDQIPFTRYAAPLIPQNWNDVTRIMSGPPGKFAPGGLTAFANYIGPGGVQRFTQDLIGPSMSVIRPQPHPGGAPPPGYMDQVSAQMRATPEPVSFLGSLAAGALMPGNFLDDSAYIRWKTATPSYLQPFMPAIEAGLRSLDQVNIPWWLRYDFRPPTPPFAASRTPTNDDWYSAWLYGNRPGLRAIPLAPLGPDPSIPDISNTTPQRNPVPLPTPGPLGNRVKTG